MNRRKFIVSSGALLGSAGAAFGTGAFTSISGSRNVDVAVVNENNAYLAMEPVAGSPNEGFAKQGPSNQMRFDFNGDALRQDGDAVVGSGVAKDSEYWFDQLFQITNQGSQTVYVKLPVAQRNDTDSTGELDSRYFYRGTDRGTALNGVQSWLQLGIGDTAEIGFYVDSLDAIITDEEGAGDDEQLKVQVQAQASDPGGTIVDKDGKSV